MTLTSLELDARGGDGWMLHSSVGVQNFAQFTRNTLHIASPSLAPMGKSIVQIVAQNARKAYAASEFKSYRALAAHADVAPNTVKNVMEPESRTPGQRGELSPRLDILDKLARAMGYEGWHLMQENFDPANPPVRVLSADEAEWHSKVEELYRKLPPDPRSGE